MQPPLRERTGHTRASRGPSRQAPVHLQRRDSRRVPPRASSAEFDGHEYPRVAALHQQGDMALRTGHHRTELLDTLHGGAVGGDDDIPGRTPASAAAPATSSTTRPSFRLLLLLGRKRPDRHAERPALVPGVVAATLASFASPTVTATSFAAPSRHSCSVARVPGSVAATAAGAAPATRSPCRRT